ncbi:MAG: VOC family protein [Rhizobiales bacterium]|nr:VOC family protein [Hyphomicrobiales bacterium]
MADENPSIISHVSLGTNRFPEARAFYERVLRTLGCRIIMEHPGAVAFGKAFPEFWIQTPYDGGTASSSNGVHISFIAAIKAEVDSFFTEAIAAGATQDGGPGYRPLYSDAYYGCFVRDLDGHKIEATYWDMELARKLGIA